MRSPTGVQPRAVRWFGETPDGGRVLTGDHVVEVPLDPHDPGGERIEVYARELRAPDLADVEQPYLVFLQGGPGGARRAPEPTGGAGWTGRCGATGCSCSTSAARDGRRRRTGTPWPPSPRAQQADRLALFRADAIVADAEALRRPPAGATCRGRRWGSPSAASALWTYLSQASGGALGPASSRAASCRWAVHPDDVYRATRPAVRAAGRRARRAAPRGPGGAGGGGAAPAGGRRGIPAVGGAADGEPAAGGRATRSGSCRAPRPSRFSRRTRGRSGVRRGRPASPTPSSPGVHEIVSYATGPPYALVHEACYGEPGVATNWSSDRVRAEQGVPAEPVREASTGWSGCR